MAIILFILNLFTPARKMSAQKAEKMLVLYKRVDAQVHELTGRIYGYYNIASKSLRETRLDQAQQQLASMRRLRDEIGAELSAFYNKPIDLLVA